MPTLRKMDVAWRTGVIGRLRRGARTRQNRVARPFNILTVCHLAPMLAPVPYALGLRQSDGVIGAQGHGTVSRQGSPEHGGVVHQGNRRERKDIAPRRLPWWTTPPCS